MCDTDINSQVLAREMLAHAASRPAQEPHHPTDCRAHSEIEFVLRAFPPTQPQEASSRCSGVGGAEGVLQAARRLSDPQAIAASPARAKSAGDANHELDRLPATSGVGRQERPGHEARVANQQGGQYR